MLNQFKVGKCYGACDTGSTPIKIIKRTATMCMVEDVDTGKRWYMRVKTRNKIEEMTNSKVPTAWREAYTYSAQFELKDAENFKNGF